MNNYVMNIILINGVKIERNFKATRSQANQLLLIIQDGLYSKKNDEIFTHNNFYLRVSQIASILSSIAVNLEHTSFSNSSIVILFSLFFY